MVSFFCMATSDNTCYCTYCQGKGPHQQAVVRSGTDAAALAERLSDGQTGKERRLEGHANIVHTAAITADGKRVASGSEDHTGGGTPRRASCWTASRRAPRSPS